MYTTFTQITSAVHLRRTRILPVAGTVLVRSGQKVNSDDVIAEAFVPTHHELIDVVRVLGLPGPKAADELIQRKVGETLSEHDIIAETGGLFSRLIRTPAPGKIISIHDGQVLIQTETKKISLPAKYSGVIAETITDRGAVIEVTAALIQGAWGNGKYASGTLLTKVGEKTSALSSADFDITARGSIIASANCTNADIFEIAAALPVGGLILGTIPSSLRATALSQPYPILLTDGFGKSSMNSAALKILSMYNNHEVVLDACMENEVSRQRPEALISAPLDNKVEQVQFSVTAGQLVRIHAAPFMGQTGSIEKVLPGLTSFPNGMRVCAARIIMDNKERKTIPIFDLDVIGFTQSS
jgi:hypothetical protein